MGVSHLPVILLNGYSEDRVSPSHPFSEGDCCMYQTTRVKILLIELFVSLALFLCVVAVAFLTYVKIKEYCRELKLLF